MPYKVQYLPSFYDMLRQIEEYMVDHDRSDASIDRYRSNVFDTCEKFATFPNRGDGTTTSCRGCEPGISRARPSSRTS